MEKLKKNISVCTLITLLIACLGEFILCFVRGYSELWYTILIPALIITILSLIGFLSKNKWLYSIATVIMITGGILLIVFPAYITYLALGLGAVSFAEEILLFIFSVRDEKR